MTSTLQERPADAMGDEPESTDIDTPPTNDPLGSLRMGVIGVILLAAAVFAFSGLRAGSDGQPVTDQDSSALAVVASDLVTSAKGTGGALDAIGGYLPGTGIVLTVQLADLGDEPMETWVQGHLDPFAERLAVLPEGEAVVVTVNEQGRQQARIWSLAPEAIAGNEGNWNQLVAPATFSGATENAVVVAEPEPALDEPVEEFLDEPIEEPIEETFEEPVAIEPDPEPEPFVEPEPEPEPFVEPEPDPEPEPFVEPDDGPVNETPTARTGGFGGDWYADIDQDGAFNDRDNWNPIFGSWVLNDGVYSQSDATGFGYAAEFASETPDEFDVTVVMRAQTGDLNGGIIYGMPEAGTKAGAKVVDLTDSGGYLRWGEYNLAGEWAFLGGAPLDPPLSQEEWNKLTLEVRTDGTTVILNDDFIATIDPVEPNGGVALVSSVASLDFKNFEVLDVRTGDAPNILIDTDGRNDGNGGDLGDGDITVISFEDSLADWSLLSGSWSAADGILTQANGQAYDQMTHFSAYEQSNYRVEVDLRALPDSDFSGGLLFNVTTFGQRAESQIFDIVDDGTVVRWAGYDQNGVFSYVGGLRVGDGFDPDAWHTLAVEVRDGRADFFVDGTQIGGSPNVGEAGYVGLVTSLAAMEFRDFTVTTLE